jgi:hypothetical protein
MPTGGLVNASLSTSLRRLPGAGRVVRALGLSGVPATGYFGAGWSLGTLLLLYWLETILVTLVVAILILRHRSATRKAGHWNTAYSVTTSRGGRTSTRSGKTSFLTGFLGVMVPFTAGHGIFVAVFAFLVFPQEIGPAAVVSADALADGMTAVAVFLLASLLLDLPGIAERPFSWVEGLANRAQGRMVVTHLTIIFGAGAMALLEAPLGFLLVFVVLKSLLDLGGMLPARDPGPKVPRAVKALGRRLPKKEGISFDEHYEAEIEAQRARSEANEEVRSHPQITT